MCLIFAFLFSINSFAAVVSDNDGSAFITKAEFDSLKNDFQSQIDQYNTSIDNKIDSAIASYLSGIKVETVTNLDSMINKINNMAEDFYLDAGGNKVKYGYRTMARTYNTLTTQKPKGAITNLLIEKCDLQGDVGYALNNYDVVGTTMARWGINGYSRTSYQDIYIPKDGYQIGKYMFVKKNNNGNYYPANYFGDMVYRYYVGGASFTYTRESGCTQLSDGYGDFSHDEFKNEDNFWSIKTGNVYWKWHEQVEDMSYDTWKCAYGGSYELTENATTFPICGTTNETVIALDEDELPTMALEPTSYTRYLWLGRGVNNRPYKNANMDDWVISFWSGSGGNIDDPTDETPEDPNQDTSWTFYFNHHPWIEINTKNMIDTYATQVLGSNVKITDGIPLFKATNDGIVDMKIYFYATSGHNLACGILKKPFDNDDNGYNIDSSLNIRDFNDVRYTTNGFPINTDVNIRMDVKKNDIIWLKAFDVTDNTAYVGAKTTEIKLTSNNK